MTSSVLADILARLDLMVFERLPEGGFLRIAPAHVPAWFSRLSLGERQDEPVTLAQAFPFLERFLVDAEDFWQKGGEGRLRSEPFTVADSDGSDVALAATAIALGRRGFLILEAIPDFEERRRTLQLAREQALEHEAHVRRTGALLPDVEAAQQLAQQLASTGPRESQELAAALRERLANLAASIEVLAPLPKGVSRRARR